MCEPSTLLIAVMTGAAIAGSPVAIRELRDLRKGSGSREENE